uniref:Methyltransferase domain-containing protein n=1 Tax=viral metagenome TaxID=1070528 RepID=A0A6C0IHL7_9ZZZZ
MPWPYNTDEIGVSKEREGCINDCKKYYSYESPFPDYDIIKSNKLELRNICKLNINYEENIDLMREITSKYIDDWNPLDYDNSINFCKNPKYNVSYPEYDAFILYCLIRHFKPKNIIEVGSGMSTRAMIDSMTIENININITCIDKYTTDEIKNNLRNLNINFIDEDIITTDLSIFNTLGENDICFIDSSHVLKNYGDVELEYLNILPSLNKNVIVHIHDIFLPYNYPVIWIVDWKCVLTEQQLLAAYLHNNSKVEILSANNYSLNKNINIPDKIEYKCGGSLWFKQT